MDEAKKILKGFLILIGVIVVLGIGIPLIDRGSPLVECQKYVEDWNTKEISTLNDKLKQAQETHKTKLNDMICNESLKREMNQACEISPSGMINYACGDASKEYQNSCHTISEEIYIDYNQKINAIKVNYNNKLKACSGQR